MKKVTKKAGRLIWSRKGHVREDFRNAAMQILFCRFNGDELKNKKRVDSYLSSFFDRFALLKPATTRTAQPKSETKPGSIFVLRLVRPTANTCSIGSS